MHEVLLADPVPLFYALRTAEPPPKLYVCMHALPNKNWSRMMKNQVGEHSHHFYPVLRERERGGGS